MLVFSLTPFKEEEWGGGGGRELRTYHMQYWSLMCTRDNTTVHFRLEVCHCHPYQLHAKVVPTWCHANVCCILRVSEGCYRKSSCEHSWCSHYINASSQYLLYTVMALGERVETSSITSPVLRYSFKMALSVQINTFPSPESKTRSSIGLVLLLSNTATVPIQISCLWLGPPKV